MGYHLSSSTISIHLDQISVLAKATFTQIARYADDHDNYESQGIRGANSFPSLNRLSGLVGKSPRTVQRALQELRDARLIRERITPKFLRICGNKGPSQMPTCYEINLTMLARLLDVSKIIETNHINWGTDEYNALITEALKFREDDWDTRLWSVGYVPHALNWDGTLEGITEKLWSTDDDDDNTDGDITDNDIIEMSNSYRIKEKDTSSTGDVS